LRGGCPSRPAPNLPALSAPAPVAVAAMSLRIRCEARARLAGMTVVAAGVLAAASAGADAITGKPVPAGPRNGSCTMAVPPARATVEAETLNAADFCELVSHALAAAVFRAPVLVTPGLLWHYADATVTCRLRYGRTRQRLTVRNSIAACRWLSRLAPNWRLETAASGYGS
jgi:hypothetical protein